MGRTTSFVKDVSNRDRVSSGDRPPSGSGGVSGPSPDGSGGASNSLNRLNDAEDVREIEALTGTGFSARVAAEDWELRELKLATALALLLSITNPKGVAGDPSFDLLVQNANKVLAGPTTGADAKPTFRALVDADFATTLVLQLARLGIGTAADATIKLLVGGGIKTAAPAGGTAAEFKVGVAASVSPTAPNRTIEMEIGGTTFYLAAKTTND